MGITLQIDDAMVASMAETIRKSIPRIARANEQMILSAPELSERLPKLSALPDDELVRGYLQFLFSNGSTMHQKHPPAKIAV
ncbi:hypothetical protein H7R52_03265 [Weissella confusa]|uniref:Uncharacterized protein n=1 Tax=Weissella confusa TaxID=1583 RepID=A0A923NEK8_WEICO|nr:hypothetical protein [Weissella confusa]